MRNASAREPGCIDAKPRAVTTIAAMSDYYTPPKLDDLDLPLGKRVRLQRLLYKYGPGNGKIMVLPIDQGMEHGPVDFFGNPDSKHPRYQFELAKHGGYSAIALQYGLAS